MIKSQNYTKQKQNDKQTWECPRCLQTIHITEYPATSRKDNYTEICSQCGIKEALETFIKK